MVTENNHSRRQMDAVASVNHATGLALQADSSSATEELALIPDGILDAELSTFRSAMIRRFGPDGIAPDDFGVSDPWIANLVKIYITYWQSALTRRDLSEAENVLQNEIAELLGHGLSGTDAFDLAEAEIRAEAARHGVCVLLGRTPPLLELMLWRRETVSQVEVQLPEGVYSVTVTWLDDFILRGWGHYATCGRRSTGGWTTNDGLFAVVPAYGSLTDETFSVRFLGHEAQHFADKQIFKGLENWELEYRAKLAELSLADSIQADNIQRFLADRSDRSRDLPHPYADFKVIRDLEELLDIRFDDGMPKDRQLIRDAARRLLIADTNRRKLNN